MNRLWIIPAIMLAIIIAAAIAAVVKRRSGTKKPELDKKPPADGHDAHAHGHHHHEAKKSGGVFHALMTILGVLMIAVIVVAILFVLWFGGGIVVGIYRLFNPPAVVMEKVFVVKDECITSSNSNPCTAYEDWDDTTRTGGKPVLVRYHGKEDWDWVLLSGRENDKITLDQFNDGEAEFKSPDNNPVHVQVGRYEYRIKENRP